jgi:hypothetical protein
MDLSSASSQRMRCRPGGKDFPIRHKSKGDRQSEYSFGRIICPHQRCIFPLQHRAFGTTRRFFAPWGNQASSVSPIKMSATAASAGKAGDGGPPPRSPIKARSNPRATQPRRPRRRGPLQSHPGLPHSSYFRPSILYPLPNYPHPLQFEIRTGLSLISRNTGSQARGERRSQGQRRRKRNSICGSCRRGDCGKGQT